MKAMENVRGGKRIITLLIALILLFSLAACGDGDADGGDQPEPEPEHGAYAAPADTAPEQAPPPKKEVYPGPDVELVEYDGVVEHLFFHPVIAYPELAFDGDYMESGLNDWMLTVNEYNAILESLYKNGYIIVNINDVWSEEYGPDGTARMGRNTLMLPEGKKPLILSYDDVNYYDYMLENGFAYKLIVGDDGEIWSWGLDPQGNEVVSQEIDAVTILDSFIEKHPDFSMYGTKGCMALTGCEGILGYRTHTDTAGLTAEQEKARQSEIEAVKPVIEKLKENGWYFGCHTWGHTNLSGKSLEKVHEDMNRWNNEVASLVGETKLMFYPHGARPDGDDVSQNGEIFTYLQGLGFRVFFSVGIEPYTKIKSGISAVIGDRMHPDGTTLRWSRERYLRFYDAAEVFDYANRPDYGYEF